MTYEIDLVTGDAAYISRLNCTIVSEFCRCMSQHFGDISKTAMFRAFKCILKGGIGGA